MLLGVVLNVCCVALWFLLSSEFSSALEAPLWVLQRKRDFYERNSVCMESQQKMLVAYGTQPIRAIVTPANTTIFLKCFECLHPDDSEELEDVWKPSASVIGRKIQQFLRKIREKIIKSRPTGTNFRRGNLAKYHWERLNGEKEWTKAMRSFDGEGGRGNESTVIKFMEEIMSKEDENMKNLFIGDHFELEIRNIDALKSGWYRCVNRTKTEEKDKLDISQIYHVDVLDNFRTVMALRSVGGVSEAYHVFISYSSEQVPEEMEKADFTNRPINEEPLLELFWRESEWTPCNKCGDKMGEQRRVKSCYLKRKWAVDKKIKAPYDVFSLFGELPCHSSLVPDGLKLKLSENLTFYEEFTECKKLCTPSRQNAEVREVTLNETGREEVLDVLPPGEYTTHERLPPLAPPIIRRTIFATEGDWLSMDCTNQDAMALIWRKDFVELNATRILSLEDGKERQRRVITSRGILVIRSARIEDAGLYSCTAYPSGQIMRTFRLFINVGDRSAEVLAAISIVVRTLLILFLLLLIFDLLNVKIPSV